MESGAIPNKKVRASTEWDANHAAIQASGSYWFSVQKNFLPNLTIARAQKLRRQRMLAR